MNSSTCDNSSLVNLPDAAALQDQPAIDQPADVSSPSKFPAVSSDILKDVTFDDVILTDNEINPIKAPPKRKSPNPIAIPKTRLVSIKGIPSMKISSADLRKVGSSLHVTGYRDMNRERFFKKVAKMKDSYDIQKASGMDVYDYGLFRSCPTHINTIRFINVIFSVTIKPKFASLPRNDLDIDLSGEEVLFREVFKEYNDCSKYQHSEFPEITLDKQALPSNFIPINPNNWKKGLEKFRLLTKNYNTCLHKWKKSGHRDDYEDINNYKRFAKGNRSVLYFHLFAQQNKIFMETLIETALEKTVRKSEKTASKKPKRKSSPDKSSANIIEAPFNSIVEFQEKKNNDIDFMDQIFRYQDRKRKLKDDLARHCKSRELARQKISAYKKYKAEKAKRKQGRVTKSDSGADPDTDSGSDEIDPQQSLIEDIIFIDTEIKALRKHKYD